MQRQTLKPFPEEPNTDTVPAMLTPGEFVIRKDAVDEIGIDKLNLMNNIDRLGQLSSLMEYRPSGYQQGGQVRVYSKRGPGVKPVEINIERGKNTSFQEGIYSVPAVLTGQGSGLRYYIGEAFSPSTGNLQGMASFDASNKVASTPSDSLESQFVDEYFSKENIKKRRKQRKKEGIKDSGTLKQSRLEKIKDLLLEEVEGMQEGGEVMLKTNKENLPNPGLKALFDSGAQGKEALANMGYEQGGKVMGYGDGGTVMDYYGGGMVKGYEGGGKVVSETLDVFGDKSSAADELNAVMALRAMRMQQGGMVPGMMPPQMPAQSLPPAGMMMQEGGMVDQPMPQSEMSDIDMSMMPDAERAYPSEPMEQMNLKPNEMMAYQEYGPDSFRYMAPKFKPRAEFTPYDAMVDAGIVDPYETSEDDFVVMTRDMANNLRGMNGV